MRSDFNRTRKLSNKNEDTLINFYHKEKVKQEQKGFGIGVNLRLKQLIDKFKQKDTDENK